MAYSKTALWAKHTNIKGAKALKVQVEGLTGKIKTLQTKRFDTSLELAKAVLSVHECFCNKSAFSSWLKDQYEAEGINDKEGRDKFRSIFAPLTNKAERLKALGFVPDAKGGNSWYNRLIKAAVHTDEQVEEFRKYTAEKEGRPLSIDALNTFVRTNGETSNGSETEEGGGAESNGGGAEDSANEPKAFKYTHGLWVRSEESGQIVANLKRTKAGQWVNELPTGSVTLDDPKALNDEIKLIVSKAKADFKTKKAHRSDK